MAERVAAVVALITSPLEQEHVERIRAVAPGRVEVVHEPDLLPATRYVADHKGVAGFVRTVDQERRWRAHLARAEVFWDFPALADDCGSLAELAPRLRWVQTTSSGVGQLVKALGVHETDLLVTTARGVHAGPLGEFVFLALLAHVKKMAHLQGEQRAHRWQRFCGDELAGRTLAIVGVGEVGRRVALLGRGFGMTVVALASPGSKRTADKLGVDRLFTAGQLHAMLAESDALVLAVPHTPATEGLIDRAAFQALKPGAVLVNIARGQVVDEAAMIDALTSGRLAFAALDVVASEPLPAESPLWDLPNVLISPHSASTAASENGKINAIFCHNLRCYLDDRIEDMQNVLDKARLY